MKIIYYLILISITVWVLSWHQLKQLPNNDLAVAEMMREPIQSKISEDNFYFSYRGTEYRVKPVADYEIWGMIATHNNINAWYNYYHDKDTVNFKDLCLVWGDNIANGVYQDTKFTSGEWTCYYEIYGQENIDKFNPKQVSNNHLLTADEKVLETIQQMKKGDQVYLRGKLVGYAESGQPENMYRMTSLTRDDHGCEIIYVEEAIILKHGKTGWYLTQTISKYSTLILVLLGVLIFITNMFRSVYKSHDE